jgi:hypothetical protein
MIILAGTKEEHLNMLEGGIIAKLLEEKWTTFAQVFNRKTFKTMWKKKVGACASVSQCIIHNIKKSFFCKVAMGTATASYLCHFKQVSQSL